MLPQAPVQLLALLLGQRQYLGLFQDTIPKVLSELDALGRAEFEQFSERSIVVILEERLENQRGHTAEQQPHHPLQQGLLARHPGFHGIEPGLESRFQII